jgi:hypothetical protein
MATVYYILKGKAPLVTPDRDCMDGPRQSRGPLGKCSSCDGYRQGRPGSLARRRRVSPKIWFFANSGAASQLEHFPSGLWPRRSPAGPHPRMRSISSPSGVVTGRLFPRNGCSASLRGLRVTICPSRAVAIGSGLVAMIGTSRLGDITAGISDPCR